MKWGKNHIEKSCKSTPYCTFTTYEYVRLSNSIEWNLSAWAIRKAMKISHLVELECKFIGRES